MKRLVVALMGALLATGCAQVQRQLSSTAGAALERALEKPEEFVEKGRELSEKYTLTPENEHYIGRAAAVKILAGADYAYADREAIAKQKLAGLTEYVSMVGTLLTAQIDKDGAWPLAGYHFVVLERPEVNAFSTPGGFVFVTTGALALMQTEDELAAVLGHEIAHICKGHGATMLQAMLTANGVNEFFSWTLERQLSLFDTLIDDYLPVILDKGYGSVSEFDADTEGANLAGRVGYDPGAMADFLRKLPASSKGGFFTAHPRSSDRISNLSTLKLMSSINGLELRRARFVEATGALR